MTVNRKEQSNMKAAEISYLFDKYGEVMTAGEVAATIRASESHVYDLISEGDLPCFCIGRQYRVLKRDVIDCLKKSLPPIPLDSVLKPQKI